MKKLIIVGLSGLALGLLGLIAGTAHLWYPRVSNSKLPNTLDTLDLLANTGTIFGWGVAGVSLILGLWKKRTAKKVEPEPPSGPDEAVLRKTYLRRLVQQAGHLSLAGVDPAMANDESAGRLQLDAVYTALLTLSADDGQHLSALAQLNEHPRLVLLGDAGSGKTTFLNFVTICLAGELLKHKELSLKLLTAPLPSEDTEEADSESVLEERQPWLHAGLMPVRVVLRDLAARGLPEPGERVAAQHLWKYIERDLAEAGIGEFAPFLKKELLEKGGLLLLDGLDEVPEAQRRREQIRQMVEGFIQSFSGCRVLLTSRTYAYQKQSWRLPGFTEAVLAPFSEGQIRLFVDRWYSHMADVRRFDRADATGRARLLQQEILSSDRLRGLAERPLLLTLMASLHASRGGNLPRRRGKLYDDAVDLLLNVWERQRVVHDANGTTLLQQPSLAEWLRVDREKVRKVLNKLAFDAHAAQAELVGTADVPEVAVVQHLMRLSRNPEANPVQLVEYLSNRAGLLVPRGVEVYTFPHRTFQEYLAACHLTTEDFPRCVARLGREDPVRWREVVLLAGAKAELGVTANIWSLANELCWREPDDLESGTADYQGAYLAGQVIAESADLTEVSGANGMCLNRLRRWHLRLIQDGRWLRARERTLAGKTLARLGDPRFDPQLFHLPKEPLLGFVEVPPGPFFMGSDPERDPLADADESRYHELDLPAYYIARYPVTVEQFRAFVNATCYAIRNRNPLAGHANHPAVNVAWEDAIAYCRWLEGMLREAAVTRAGEGPFGTEFWEGFAAGRWLLTLPSEAEWEKAVRGTDGRTHAWSSKTEPDLANWEESGLLEPSSVGCFPLGVSPYGCEEMSGNVWEWTRSLYASYPYPAGDAARRQREDVSASGARVMRGGSFQDDASRLRCAARNWDAQTYASSNVGFRIALTPAAEG